MKRTLKNRICYNTLVTVLNDILYWKLRRAERRNKFSDTPWHSCMFSVYAPWTDYSSVCLQRQQGCTKNNDTKKDYINGGIKWKTGQMKLSASMT